MLDLFSHVLFLRLKQNISISLFQEQPEENLYLKKTFISLFKSKDMFLSNQ